MQSTWIDHHFPISARRLQIVGKFFFLLRTYIWFLNEKIGLILPQIFLGNQGTFFFLIAFKSFYYSSLYIKFQMKILKTYWNKLKQKYITKRKIKILIRKIFSRVNTIVSCLLMNIIRLFQRANLGKLSYE